MMKENLDNYRDKDFYNDLISKDAGIYGQEPHEIAYYPLWKWILNRISYKSKILDIGCGTGRFAKLCDGIYGSVIGVDFSEVAIEKAKVYAPKAKFLCLDIEELNTDLFKILDYEVVVFSEILEHIKDDLSLIEQVPSGKIVFLTVPNFGSEGHTRWFSNMDDVKNRYEKLLDTREVFTFGSWYAIMGVRDEV